MSRGSSAIERDCPVHGGRRSGRQSSRVNERVMDADLQPERGRSRADALADASIAQQAQRPTRSRRMTGAGIQPVALRELVPQLLQASHRGQHQQQGVVGDLVQAVVRHVRDPDAPSAAAARSTESTPAPQRMIRRTSRSRSTADRGRATMPHSRTCASAASSRLRRGTGQLGDLHDMAPCAQRIHRWSRQLARVRGHDGAQPWVPTPRSPAGQSAAGRVCRNAGGRSVMPYSCPSPDRGSVSPASRSMAQMVAPTAATTGIPGPPRGARWRPPCAPRYRPGTGPRCRPRRSPGRPSSSSGGVEPSSRLVVPPG